MIWASVWTALVIGTLLGAFFLGRSLWRRGRALGHELARAGAAAERLSERVAELEDARARPAWVHPLLVDAEDRTGWRAGLAARRASRRARRSAARGTAHARWNTLWR
jgi:hypothetical protein